MQTRTRKLLYAVALIAAASPLLALISVSLLRGNRVHPTGPAQPEASPTASPLPAAAAVTQAPAPDVPTISAPVETTSFTLPPAHVFGAEVMLGDFRVRAVNRFWAGPGAAVLTLDEALAEQLCTISETGQRGAVLVEIRGTQSVLLLTGELLLGGRQDRLVARSTVLDPGHTILPVFCAEVSRWTPEDGDFRGTFTRGPQADLNVRAAMWQVGTQDAVWSAITQVKDELQVPDPSGSGSYRFAYDSPAARQVDEMLLRTRRIVSVFTVGFAVFRDGQLVAADIFDGTVLLDRVADKLLRSYAMTAVYGDVSFWVMDKSAPEASPPEPTAPPAPEPPGFVPPPPPIEDHGDDWLRFECRARPDQRPVHTGIFRKSRTR